MRPVHLISTVLRRSLRRASTSHLVEPDRSPTQGSSAFAARNTCRFRQGSQAQHGQYSEGRPRRQECIPAATPAAARLDSNAPIEEGDAEAQVGSKRRDVALAWPSVEMNTMRRKRRLQMWAGRRSRLCTCT